MGKKPTSANVHSANEELHWAARSGDLKAVQAICSSNPLAVNSRDRHSRTPYQGTNMDAPSSSCNSRLPFSSILSQSNLEDFRWEYFIPQSYELRLPHSTEVANISPPDASQCSRRS